MTAILYELIGHGWSWPIWTTPLPNGLVEVVLPDIQMLKIQRATVEKSLTEFAHHREDKTWFYSQTVLDQAAVMSQHSDPEEVVVWRRIESEPDPKITDFVEAYARSRDAIRHPWFTNPEGFRLIWSSISKFMLEYLLFRDGQIDLGWAKIDAFCTRANWKTAVLGRITAQRKNRTFVTEEFARREIRRTLHQSFMTALDEKARVCRWSLDITPTKTFHEAAQVREIKRKRNKRGSYLYQILTQLKSAHHKTRMYESFIAFAKETTFKIARLPHGFEPSSGDAQPIPSLPPTKFSPPPTVAGHSMASKTGQAVVSEDALLLQVSDLQSLAQDVRDTRNEVDGSGDESADVARMFLLYAVPSKVRRELLSRGKNGGADGMASAPESNEVDNGTGEAEGNGS